MSLLASIFGPSSEDHGDSGSSIVEEGVAPLSNKPPPNQLSQLFARKIDLPEPQVNRSTGHRLKEKNEAALALDKAKKDNKRKSNLIAAESEKNDEREEEQDGIPAEERRRTRSSSKETHPGAHDEQANDRTVFVGNLPLSTTRKSLAKLFASCGKIQSTRLRSVAVTGVKLPPQRAGDQSLVKKVCVNTHQIDTQAKSSVQGYVVFEDVRSVTAALALNNTVISDNNGAEGATMQRRLRVDRANPTYEASRSVFVGNLPYGAEESTLQDCFSRQCELQVEDIEGVRIVRDKETFQCKGFGYVLFREKNMVSVALRRMVGFNYMGQPLRVTVCGQSAGDRKKQDDAKRASRRSDNKDSSIDDSSKRVVKAAPSPVGALKRILAKQAKEANNKHRARGEKKTGKPTARKAGVSKRAAAEAKVEKRVKKLQKRISKGMGKARVK